MKPPDEDDPEPETWDERPTDDEDDKDKYERERPPHHGT